MSRRECGLLWSRSCVGGRGLDFVKVVYKLGPPGDECLVDALAWWLRFTLRLTVVLNDSQHLDPQFCRSRCGGACRRLMPFGKAGRLRFRNRMAVYREDRAPFVDEFDLGDPAPSARSSASRMVL